MHQKCQIKLKPNGMVYKTHKITISVNVNTENFDALKRYKSTEVDQRTWLHLPSGTPWSTCRDTHQVVEIWKETYLDVYTILNRI